MSRFVPRWWKRHRRADVEANWQPELSNQAIRPLSSPPPEAGEFTAAYRAVSDSVRSPDVSSAATEYARLIEEVQRLEEARDTPWVIPRSEPSPEIRERLHQGRPDEPEDADLAPPEGSQGVRDWIRFRDAYAAEVLARTDHLSESERAAFFEALNRTRPTSDDPPDPEVGQTTTEEELAEGVRRLDAEVPPITAGQWTIYTGGNHSVYVSGLSRSTELVDQPLGSEEVEVVAPAAEETIEHTLARMFLRLGPPPEPTELDYTPAGTGGGGVQQ